MIKIQNQISLSAVSKMKFWKEKYLVYHYITRCVNFPFPQ